MSRCRSPEAPIVEAWLCTGLTSSSVRPRRILVRHNIDVDAQTYGFPRLYRRSRELSRYLTSNKVVQEKVADSVKTALRIPKKFKDMFKGTGATNHFSINAGKNTTTVLPRVKHSETSTKQNRAVSSCAQPGVSFAARPFLQKHR